jgi:hypothetical protein
MNEDVLKEHLTRTRDLLCEARQYVEIVYNETSHGPVGGSARRDMEILLRNIDEALDNRYGV